ncbi:MAG: hypothetical protein ACFCUI_06950 [Bernardetiaceae bacterium]
MLDLTITHPTHGLLTYEFALTFVDTYIYGFIDSLFEEQKNILWQGKLSDVPEDFWQSPELARWKNQPITEWAQRLGAGLLIKYAPQNPRYHAWS